MPYAVFRRPSDPLKKVSEKMNVKVLGKNILQFSFFRRPSLPIPLCSSTPILSEGKGIDSSRSRSGSGEPRVA